MAVPLAPRTTVLALQYAEALGYCVHGTPVYESLKRQRPDLRLVVATNRLGSATLSRNPHVDALIETPSPFMGFVACVRAIAAQLCDLGITPAVVLADAANPRTKIGLAAALASRGYRLGFSLAPPLLHEVLDYDPTQSHLANNLRLLEPLGLRSDHVEPAVYFDAADLAVARALIARHARPGAPTAIFVTQGSGGQRSNWRNDRFARVVEHVHDVYGYNTLYVGVPADRPHIEALRASAGGRGASIAGQTTIPQLAALLCIADLVVSMDTGTMHVGRAAQTPMVVLAPSWQSKITWLPLGQPQICILRGEDTQVGFPGPAGYQLDDIEVEVVIAAVTSMIRTHPPQEAARTARVRRLRVESHSHGSRSAGSASR